MNQTVLFCEYLRAAVELICRQAVFVWAEIHFKTFKSLKITKYLAAYDQNYLASITISVVM